MQSKALKKIIKNPTAMVCIALLLVIIFACTFCKVLAPYGFDDQELANRLQGPSAAHIFGTDEYGRDVGYDLDPDGRGLHIWRVDLAGKTLRAVCEVAFYPMEDGSDEPQIPEYAQAYLADYICYRHLSNGNPVKQRQAQFYLNSFLRGMQRLRPQGMGSVTHRKHIYDVTDTRYCR